MVISGTLAHGQDSGNWCPMGVIGDYPPDQRAEDGRSVTFTSQPLEESLDILGFPEVSMRLSANRERALISVRLCEVFPDGTSSTFELGVAQSGARRNARGGQISQTRRDIGCHSEAQCHWPVAYLKRMHCAYLYRLRIGPRPGRHLSR